MIRQPSASQGFEPRTAIRKRQIIPQYLKMIDINNLIRSGHHVEFHLFAFCNIFSFPFPSEPSHHQSFCYLFFLVFYPPIFHSHSLSLSLSLVLISSYSLFTLNYFFALLFHTLSLTFYDLIALLLFLLFPSCLSQSSLSSFCPHTVFLSPSSYKLTFLFSIFVLSHYKQNIFSPYQPLSFFISYLLIFSPLNCSFCSQSK